MADIPEPKTRLERYWAGILDKIDGGGGGGGGTAVEVVEGTVANPFGTYTTNDIYQMLNDGTVLMRLQVGTRVKEDYSVYAESRSSIKIFRPNDIDQDAIYGKVGHYTDVGFSYVSEVDAGNTDGEPYYDVTDITEDEADKQTVLTIVHLS